jgi:ABC-type phosphate transport system permease subunit
MYEPISVPPISRARFVRRLLRQGGYAAVLAGISLLLGTSGFKAFAHQKWLDAFLNASMLLGGMGPVGEPANWPASGKMFGALFALYAGLVFLIMAGLLATPVFHRVIHRFHWEGRDPKKPKS